jgi:RNA polymerase sigma-70 factor (ECF subfamily)
VSDQRHRFYTGIFHGLFQRGERDHFLNHFQDDLHLVCAGEAARGRAHLAALIDEDIEAYVSSQPQRVFGSGPITVVESRFINPPEDPDHCPPGMALVIFQRDERAYRLHVHLSSRPPQPDDA